MKSCSSKYYFALARIISFFIALLFTAGFGYETAIAQVGWSSSNNPYTQNFGTSVVASWTDNSTFSGWYAISWKITTAGTNGFITTENITTATPTNPGGWQVYQCNGGSDMKLGTRPSNNDGGPDSPGLDGRNGEGLGLCLKNNFSGAIKSLKVDFDWFQLSLAENGNEANQNFFSYFVSASNLVGADLPNNAHAYTNVAAGNYTAPNNDATAGANQVSGYPCTVSGHQSFCFAVTVPVNSYIMLRWWDPNNANNDPHMAIDNVSVSAYSDNSCVSLLPVELLNFTATPKNNTVEIAWQTANELNNNYFSVERSADGKGFSEIKRIKGAGTSSQLKSYTAIDEDPLTGTSYYRLRQTDFDGTSSFSEVISARYENGEKLAVDVFPNPVSFISETTIHLQGTPNSKVLVVLKDVLGKEYFSKALLLENGNYLFSFDTNEVIAPGVYFITAAGNDSFVNRKIVIK